MNDDYHLFDGCLPRMFAAVAVLLLILLSGCKTGERLVHDNTVVYFHDTINVVKTDSFVVDKTLTLRDSVFVKDSTMVSRDSLGNVLKEVWHYKYLYQGNESRYEALMRQYEQLKEKKDSVVYETRYEKETIKESPTLWDRFSLVLGGFIVALGVVLLFRIMYKLK